MKSVNRWILGLWLGCSSALIADERGEGITFFENRIRPLLVEHCYRCHGSDEQESDLRLDTIQGIRRGGAAGMAIVPGEPEQSLLLTAVNYVDDDLQMPPDVKLSDRQIADLEHWIEIGAPHPDSDSSLPKPTAAEVAADRHSPVATSAVTV